MEKDKYWEVNRTFPNKENEKVVNEFLLHLKLANKSKLTIINYRRFLQRFFEEKKEAFSSLSSEQLLAWIQTHHSHLKETTYRYYLDVLSSFYNFCVQESFVDRSPIKRRWFPRLPKSLPKYLEKTEVAKLRQASEKRSLRNQALLEFMLTSGCRVGEVHLLNQGDIDLINRTTKVKGKGNKIRHVHFTDKCAVFLERYLETCPKSDTSPLFVSSRSDNRLSIRGIQEIMAKMGKKAGLASHMHPHRLRHTFATELLAKGAELSFIGDELGHANLNTTRVYARIPKRDIITKYRTFMG